VERARRFHKLHDLSRLLILPNIWDAMGARLLVGLGYPAVATASAAVAFSHGYDDGERIPFATLLQTVANLTRAVDVPVTVDIERGYAESLDELANNIAALLATGAVGINLEDGVADNLPLRSLEEQCQRIQAVRRAANELGVPLFINARTDVFLGSSSSLSELLPQAIERGKAYRQSGADGFYPISLADLKALGAVQREVDLPVNVYAGPTVPDASTLQRAGIARLSAGPGVLRAAFTAMHAVACELLDSGRSATMHRSLKSDAIRRSLNVGSS
jgi:2-methylisocitrate lyase-like PEP mutase family enzyme